MKRPRNLFLVLIALQFLTSCAITRGIWGSEGISKYEEVDSFFIDQKQNRIVLIGVGNFKEIKDHWHYSISDPTGRLIKIFELAQKSGDINFSMHGVETEGSDVIGGFWISFRKQNLSSEDMKFAEKEGLIKGKNKEFLGCPCRFDNDKKKRNDSYRWPLAKTIHYPSSKETVTNFCSDSNKTPDCVKITKFSEPWKGQIFDRYTTGEKTLRVVATPFAIVADIILLPFYVLAVIGMGVSGH